MPGIIEWGSEKQRRRNKEKKRTKTKTNENSNKKKFTLVGLVSCNGIRSRGQSLKTKKKEKKRLHSNGLGVSFFF